MGTKTGFIYILTNPSFKEYVKIGYTNVKEFGGIIDWPYETVKD